MRISNQKARFDYDIGDTIEAGIELTGAEVKSAKLGQVDMGNASVRFKPNRFGGWEAWIVNMHIYPYKHADNKTYIPTRTRKLLMHQKEMVSLQSNMKQSRRLLVPIAMYTHSGLVKIELGLARGKKKYEKREEIKKRDLEREERA